MTTCSHHASKFEPGTGGARDTTFANHCRFKVVDFVVLMAKVCDPAPREEHLTAALHGLATSVEVTELIGDPTYPSTNRRTSESAHDRSR
jgi:hypothetical protein